VPYYALEFEAVFNLKNKAPLLPREKAKMRLAAVLVWTLAFAPPVWSALPTPDKMSEAKGLIDARELDRAEKIIVAEMMTTPQDPDWITLLAQVRLGQNRTREALKLLEDADQIAGITAARAMLISLAESQAGHMDLAEPPLRTAIRLDPFNASAHYFLGRLLYTDNRFDEAIEESNKAISLAPGFVRAYENLGLCYEGKHDLTEAERWYLKAIDREATSESKTEWPMLDLATMMIRENRYAEAKPYLTQAIDINPRNIQSLFQMGILLERTGDLKGALDQFRAAIQSDQAGDQPGRASAYYRAALLCKKLGYADEATEDFKKFNEIHDAHHHISP
jgi:tetratricopeptide (TPR) repeat protein